MASKILLGKVLPDMQSVRMEGRLDGGIEIRVRQYQEAGKPDQVIIDATSGHPTSEKTD